jgi:hypothetical protein
LAERPRRQADGRHQTEQPHKTLSPPEVFRHDVLSDSK